MSDRIKVLPQYLLPKQALTTFAGRVASYRGGAHTTTLIRWFVGKYGVNMDEAVNPDIASYASFNEFFTRPLRDGVLRRTTPARQINEQVHELRSGASVGRKKRHAAGGRISQRIVLERGA